jgi:hypothetical protein
MLYLVCFLATFCVVAGEYIFHPNLKFDFKIVCFVSIALFALLFVVARIASAFI